MEIFRVILPVDDIDRAATFYGHLLGSPGERVTSGRHYFDCGGVLLACWDAVTDGDERSPGPNPGHVYFSTDAPLEELRERALASGAVPDEVRGRIASRPWGERSVYFRDPWGNRLCIVQAGTEYRGGPFVWNPGEPS